EKARFIAMFMAFLSYSQNAFLKWREKMLEPPLWMGWELLIMNLVSSAGGKAFWKERGYLFGEEFRRHVENDLMKRTPHPDAKPMGAFSIGRRAEPVRWRSSGKIGIDGLVENSKGHFDSAEYAHQRKEGAKALVSRQKI